MKHFFPAFLFFILSSQLIAQAPAPTGQWLAPASKPKTFGLNNSKGDVAAEAKFDMLEEADGKGWIAFSEGKYGVINSSGAWIIKPNYEIIVQFLNGKAVAGKKNKTKITTRKEDYYYYDTPVDSTVYYGVIDASGVWIVEPEYDFIRLSEDGTALYTDANDKIGFLNTDGSVMIRAKYEYATRMNDGVAVIGEPVQTTTQPRYTYRNEKRFRTGNYFVIDRSGNKLNTEPYELIREFKEGRAAFNNDGIWKNSRYGSEAKLIGGKWGYLDASGKEIIAPVYDYVYDFENGKAKVRSGQRIFWIDRNGKETEPPAAKAEKEFTIFCSPGFFGYIGLDGQYVIEPQYLVAKDFSEGLAAVLPLRAADMECEYVPETNAKEFETTHRGYSRILNRFLNLDRDYDIDFNTNADARFLMDSIRMADSMMAVARYTKRLYGYIDKTGNLVLPAKYEIALPFHDGRAYVLYHEKWGVIDTKGNWIFSPVLEWPDELSYIGSDYSDEGSGQYYRYSYNDNGVVRGFRANVYSFSEGIGCIYKYGKYGFIDSTGKIITAPVYDDVRPFRNGLAAVRHGYLWGYVDKTGKEVIPLAYASAEDFTVEGLACVATSPKRTGDKNADVAMEYENDEARYYGFIDKKGSWAIKPQFTEASSFSNGVAVASLNYEKSGYIDKSGKFVIPPKYDYAGDFEYGFALVRINMYDPVFIDKSGKVSKTVTPANPPKDKSIPLRPHLGDNYYFGYTDVKGDEKIPHIFSAAGNFVLVK